ncbi:helix-turn-helix domain-containing protein [Muribacter muris]|uniref:Helix-turn-helix domain-containing protein n=2 Tax=Pseudomonadota TaxID=1224 RepID=A0A6L9Y865_9BURK|nr:MULTISPECIES: helix-turn-helix transcriptional regulator [Pseudomonadota]MBF0784897.1 helix-turn-helix domain-containing protein [Muribacter muris]MBF0826516.1 helix-turn-helix domain-containing protein [Muribacter muris]MCX2961935.1 helix-turn-helix domain-containing protein [Rodentibacter heylii]MDC2825039.1 helix-turn-helix domain-containing protein [Rodentibacter pneumotropicus]NEN76566.1 helix-turn-helix domain-containing protein [Pelistega ratti]
MSIKEQLRFRLRSVIESSNTSIKAFSEQTGIPLRTLHNYLSGEREPSVENIIKVASEFNINLNWLLLGKNEMYLNDSLELTLNSSELELLNKYRLTNDSGKIILQKTSEIILNELK